MPAETSSLRTLVADDDPDIRSLMEITAIMAGLDVVAVVSNGRSALDAIERGGIDLAILDVSMPELSGLEVLESIRSSGSRTEPRVVMVSASVDEASLIAGISLGADDYVTKPFSPRALARRLRELIEEWEEQG